MPKFEVAIEYKVTETYEITTKDADAARIIASGGTRAPHGRKVEGKNVVSVKQMSPRYEIKAFATDKFAIIDTKFANEVIATARFEDVANTILDTFNSKEEAK